uniref:WW domain-containing protein n=1 Tax=Globisporangium ultimum (strain ATCC 200006 / CBS 805.95 / DAOM BR144) TaxID=431595 RepID=K3X2U5_GLOUD
MALPSRKNWDLTHLATKYPWLRVDSETIEEFRSPFQWVDAPAPRTQQNPGKQRGHGHTQQRGASSKHEDEDGGSSSDSGEDDDERFSLSERHDSALLFETIQYDVDLLKQRDKTRKKKARIEEKRKQKHNILSLSFPVLLKANSMATNQHPDGALAMRYTKQLHDLADAERKLKELVTSQIEAEKAKLPLSFLFERNLDRTYCKEQSVRTITSIFTRLQHRMLCAAFERWHVFLLGLQKEDRKQAAFQRSQMQALALFDKLANDAYIGTLDCALHRWRQITHEIVYEEQRHAATVIQMRFRQRHAKALLAGFNRVALDKEFKRKVEIQQLLKFEAYGTAMRWSTLRNGFNLLLQNICARRIQFFFRRIMLRKRIQRRVERNHAAIRIQSPWRRKLARKELARRKELFRIHQELKAHSATVIQRHVRGFLAKAALARRQTWQSNKNQRALDIQRCWRKYRQRVELYHRFEVRRQILDAEIARLAQLRYEAMREAAARDIQRVFHGFQGRSTQAGDATKADMDPRHIGAKRVTRIRELKAREELLTKNAALLIQKRARGMDARKVTLLLRQAMQLVELEQSRQYRDSSRESSPLLQFMTEHYLHGGGRQDVVQHFTNAQCVWLEDHIRTAQAQIAKEDHAIVFLQRMYRGFVARVDYVVKKMQAIKRRELETAMAIKLQRVTRGFLTRRHVVRMRQKQKLGTIKLAYIRERKWKEDELMWREQYQREQMELQLRKVKVMELKMKEAKRDAELAKWRAEAAAFKKQELQAQHDLEKQQRKMLKESKANNTSDSSMELEEGWTELHDACENVYYYNETTFESVWDRPVKKNMPATKDKTSPTNASPPSIGPEDTAISSQKEVQDQSDAVPDGNCWKCRTAVATKECLDCHDSLQRHYCAPCFLLEHHTFPDDTGAKQRHDFRVLIKVKQQSHCLSLACKTKKGGANLATYYCEACPTIVSSTTPAVDAGVQTSLPGDLAAATRTQASAKGCFFCEECFPAAHESAQVAVHVASASLHFRAGAIMCCDCSARVGTRLCEQCDEEFCSQCFDRIHLQSQKKRDHVWALIEILKDELTSAKDVYCIECDRHKCTRLCNLCGDGFCDSCFVTAHDKGKKRQHTWIAWESFAQVGDWLEIFDEKANATIFFNIETKESATKQPFVLKSGAERHQLQFHEREQLQKRKELELESEIIQLKEKLHEMQEREALTQRPQSRNLRSSGTTRAEGKPDAASSDASGSENPTKKRGLFGNLFSRKQKANKATIIDGLTPEERKRQ